MYRHILDTLKEWQLKLGLPQDSLWLRYPQEELADLLGVPFDHAAQTSFACFVAPTLGDIVIDELPDGFCRLLIPAKGLRYAESQPTDPFLADLIALSQDPFCTMEKVYQLFASYPHRTFPLPDDPDAVVFERVGRPILYVFDEHDGLVEYHRLTVARFRRLYGDLPA